MRALIYNSQFPRNLKKHILLFFTAKVRKITSFITLIEVHNFYWQAVIITDCQIA